MTMKTIRLLTTLLAALALTACTHNNGDIGIWFGTWHVTTITANGTPVAYDGDYFFQFQSSVFRVCLVQQHEQTTESYGTWSEADDGTTMSINFVDPQVYYLYVPGFETSNVFTVSRGGSSQATFTRTAADGVTYVYALNKQP